MHNLKIINELWLKVIDGLPAYKVKIVKQSAKPCLNDNHCAAHGSGTYFCCKCGAEFRII